MIDAIHSDSTGTRFSISGALDADGALALRPTLEALATGTNRNVILDMNKVAYIDGSGIGALAFTFKRLAARGLTLKVEGARGQPLELLHKLGLGRTLGLAPTTAPRRPSLAAVFGLARAA